MEIHALFWKETHDNLMLLGLYSSPSKALEAWKEWKSTRNYIASNEYKIIVMILDNNADIV